jgi:phage shock protein A
VKNELIAEYEKQIGEKDKKIERMEKDIRELKTAAAQLKGEKETASKYTYFFI